MNNTDKVTSINDDYVLYVAFLVLVAGFGSMQYFDAGFTSDQKMNMLVYSLVVIPLIGYTAACVAFPYRENELFEGGLDGTLQAFGRILVLYMCLPLVSWLVIGQLNFQFLHWKLFAVVWAIYVAHWVNMRR